MEKKGQINCYLEYRAGRLGGASLRTSIMPPLAAPQRKFYSINLADGVTPFMAFVDGVEYASNMYRIPAAGAVLVTRAYYRPTAAEFAAADRETKDHVLNGGLLPAALADAVARQLENDPIAATMDFETAQTHFHAIYGERMRNSPVPAPPG